MIQKMIKNNKNNAACHHIYRSIKRASPDYNTRHAEQNNLSHNKNEQGNILFYILLGVALFAALVFTVSRGMRGQTSSALSARQIDIAASEILSEAQSIERAINHLRRKNISENDLCFTHNLNSTINNTAYSSIATCSENTYRLYHPQGGNLTYKKIPEDWLDSAHAEEHGYGEWTFTNVNGVEGIGQSIMNDAKSMELIAFLPYINKELCKSINDKLSIGTLIPDNGNDFAPVAVSNGFQNTTGQISASKLKEKYAGCFQSTNPSNSYIFYQVLIER